MTIGGIPNNILVSDLDDTLIHKFLSKEENSSNLIKILQLYNKAIIVINTARSYRSIIQDLQIPSDYLSKNILITNCGQRIFLQGIEDNDWKKIVLKALEPSYDLIINIKSLIEKAKYKVEKVVKVDKFYVNYKVSLLSKSLENELNQYLINTEFCICSNKNNVKLISKYINKGTAFKFIKSKIPKIKKIIGLGNNVLDYFFLQYCNDIYWINNSEIIQNSISIYNQKMMENFIKLLTKQIIMV